ncbi:MCE family protein [Nocardioides bigeumensis]|uniref:MCE family protein n=1 Tax=Nocardioides bigeumensis TaxID=433657 RepID=A0ABN2YR20_9ACTN
MRLGKSHKTLGIVFLAMLLLGVYLTYGIFTKKFTDYDELTLRTSKIGLQLPARADVKTRGVIVGEVLEFDADSEGAVLTLGIYPDKLGTIPANVTGSIVPKTLFGEKYVSLEIPESGPEGTIEAGATIDRTEVSIEVEKVLSDLYPLLRAVRPADLNYTLNALATALEGRGEQIGENLETLDAYLKRINPQIPDIVEDLRLTARVSDLYVDVLPDVAEILRDTIKTTGTLEGREAKLRALFRDVASFSDTARAFLDDNEDNLIRLGDLSAAQLRLFAKYAPEYPCLLGGIVNAGKAQAEAFRGFTLHIVLELLPNQPRGYTPADAPRFGEDSGPNCLHLPSPPFDQENPVSSQPDFDDGVDEPTGKGTSRTAPGFGRAGDGWSSGAGYAGGPDEAGMLRTLLGPALGVTPDQVDDLGVLLVAPMARGAEVSLR